jgi:hypothetical protein
VSLDARLVDLSFLIVLKQRLVFQPQHGPFGALVSAEPRSASTEP